MSNHDIGHDKDPPRFAPYALTLGGAAALLYALVECLLLLGLAGAVALAIGMYLLGWLNGRRRLRATLPTRQGGAGPSGGGASQRR